MYKLYYTPGACSMAPHILLNELGLEYTLEKVNLKTKLTKSGEDFKVINPKGVIPFLVTPEGKKIGESAIILQFLAHRHQSALLPDFGTDRYFEMAEWLHYVATDLHKGFTPLFAGHNWIQNTEGLGQLKESTLKILAERLSFVNRSLESRDYLIGELSLADFYLFNVASWSKFVDIRLDDYPALSRFMSVMSERSSVKKVFEAEGLG
jgi:glutathione S-transferase